MAAEETPLARAKALALRQLALRARSEREIRARLARAELSAVADAVVGWLAGLGYLDDRAFAADRARALLGPGRLGPRQAERRILAAGVGDAEAREAVQQALASVGGGSQAELSLCRALAERRARADPTALDERARARLARYLLRRGFSGPVVARVVGLREDVDAE
jgi:regulatory protein